MAIDDNVAGVEYLSSRSPMRSLRGVLLTNDITQWRIQDGAFVLCGAAILFLIEILNLRQY